MPENMINRYDTRTLLDTVTYQEPKPSMFENTFFTGEAVTYPTKYAEWDEVRKGASMARYVSDKLEVDPTEIEPFITKEIETPRYQEKRTIDLFTFNTRSPGENIYSPRTPADRAQEAEDGAILFCMDSCDRRREQQCAQTMVQGRVDITGKGVNLFVDFGLPFKLTLSRASRWGQPNVDFMKNLVDWSTNLRKRGYNPDMLLMDLAVADIFLNDERIKPMLDNQRMFMGQIAPGPIKDLFGSTQYFGELRWPGLGVISLYTYVGTYKNDKNEEVPYLDKGRLLMLTPESRRNRVFYGGETIYDENETPIHVEGYYIPEIFTDRRARNKTFMVTQRALPVPFQYDSWYTVNVLGGGN